MSKFEGPFDRIPKDRKLIARSATPEESPRVEGYSLLNDFSNHLDWSSFLYLCFFGELPPVEKKWLFEQVLFWCAPIHVGHAALHSGIITKICDAQPSSVAAVTASALTEKFRVEYLRYEEFKNNLNKFHIPTNEFFDSKDQELDLAKKKLVLQMEKRGFQTHALIQKNWSRQEVAWILLMQLSEIDELKFQWIHLLAQMPICLSEIKKFSVQDMMSYAVHMPRVDYEE